MEPRSEPGLSGPRPALLLGKVGGLRVPVLVLLLQVVDGGGDLGCNSMDIFEVVELN